MATEHQTPRKKVSAQTLNKLSNAQFAEVNFIIRPAVRSLLWLAVDGVRHAMPHLSETQHDKRSNSNSPAQLGQHLGKFTSLSRLHESAPITS